MITDVFFERYRHVQLRTSFKSEDRRLINQCFSILSEDLLPVQAAGKDDTSILSTWKSVHSRICRELGCLWLAAPAASFQGMERAPYWSTSTFMTQPYQPEDASADFFLKVRLSVVELAFRLAFEQIQRHEAILAGRDEFYKAMSFRDLQQLRPRYQQASEELSARLMRAGLPLTYHNGFIQVSRDERLAEQVERPFWAIVQAPKWANVDIEMKEALDRRDQGANDVAFYAGKALESAVKIINQERGWSTGKETGAADHITKLHADNGSRLLAKWEVETMKHIFSKLRNPASHGAGGEPQLVITPVESEWVISMCMTWISYLIRSNEAFTPP